MMATPLPSPFRGIYPVMPTPFHKDGRLDEASVERLAAFMAEQQADGLIVLGGLGEGAKLGAQEQETVLRLAISATGGTIPVIAGLNVPSSKQEKDWSEELASLGAAGLLVSPTRGTEERQVESLRRLGAATALPLVLQDYPEVSGVQLSVQFLCRLASEIPQLAGLKLEDRPTPAKITGLRKAGLAISIFGGLGALYFLEELGRGADGAMSGFSRPDILVGIWNAYLEGDHSRARNLFYGAAPLLRLEFQPGTGLALRKEAFRLQGLIETAHVREPGLQIDQHLRRELEEVLHWLAVRANGS